MLKQTKELQLNILFSCYGFSIMKFLNVIIVLTMFTTRDSFPLIKS